MVRYLQNYKYNTVPVRLTIGLTPVDAALSWKAFSNVPALRRRRFLPLSVVPMSPSSTEPLLRSRWAMLPPLVFLLSPLPDW